MVNGLAVGMAFGHQGFAGNWWYDRVLKDLGEHHPRVRDAWVFVELSVKAAWRRQGIATLLHDTLLAAQSCPRAILSTAIDNLTAQRFYLEKGWRVLHAGFAFREGQGPYVVLGREVETSSDRGGLPRPL